MTDASHYIAGRWIEGQGPPATWTDPTDGSTAWSGRSATPTEVDQAVASARQAFETWCHTPFESRIELTRLFAGQLTTHKAILAETISRDTGKPCWESKAEVDVMVAKFDRSISAYHERRSATIQEASGMVTACRYKPHGVCGVLGPFNLPGHLPNGHIVPALIAGNTIVFKPSEQAPATGQYMTQLWHDVGLPTGVINTIQGGGQTGMALSKHPDLDGLFFTGSFGVGRMLSRQFADTPGKILALEMGGNNPLVAWDVSDLDAAAYLIIQSAFITSGQRCTCARRLIIPIGPPGDVLLDRIVQRTSTLRVGRWNDDPQPFMGPVISARAAKKLLESQREMVQHGGQIIVEMKTFPGCPAMLSPGLMDVTDMSNRGDDELFGPLLQIVRVSDFDAAINEANRTRYGLAAGLLSDRRDLYDTFYKRVQAGVINWNRPTTGASGALPFGGIGDSGNHRPSGYWAGDYCSYPIASMEQANLSLPDKLPPGLG